MENGPHGGPSLMAVDVNQGRVHANVVGRRGQPLGGEAVPATWGEAVEHGLEGHRALPSAHRAGPLVEGLASTGVCPCILPIRAALQPCTGAAGCDLLPVNHLLLVLVAPDVHVLASCATGRKKGGT